MSNNMIKNVYIKNSDLIQHKICVLINAILDTGYSPFVLKRSIIIPIIKYKNKEWFDTNNFRPITVSNLFTQILEKVILGCCRNLLNTSNL